MTKIYNERLSARRALYTDKDFVDCWLSLMATPVWSRKSPRVREMHLDKLAKYPVAFATYLVAIAAAVESSYIVPDNYVEKLFEEWKYREGIGFQPPTVQEVREFCKEHKYVIDVERFVAYYEGRGWRDKSGFPIYAWRSKVVVWHYNKIRMDRGE